MQHVSLTYGSDDERRSFFQLLKERSKEFFALLKSLMLVTKKLMMF